MSRRRYHWMYAEAPGCYVGLMICTACRLRIESGEFRYRETDEAFLPQHRACCEADPKWAQLDREREFRAAPKFVTIVVPPGYKTAEEFAAGCDLEIVEPQEVPRAYRETVRQIAAAREQSLARAVEQRADLVNALSHLVSVIDAAGLMNLSNGVQLGPTVWYVKASEAMEIANSAIAAVKGERE